MPCSAAAGPGRPTSLEQARAEASSVPVRSEHRKPAEQDVHLPVFLGRQGRLKARRIQNLFRHYAAEAALPRDRRHLHCLRHSVAVHLLDAGEEIDFVRDHLAHKSIQSTMTYAQISDTRRNRSIRRLERSRDFPIPS